MSSETLSTRLTADYLYYTDTTGKELGIGSYTESSGNHSIAIKTRSADGTEQIVKILNFGNATGTTLDLARYLTIGDKLQIGMDLTDFKTGYGCLDFIEGDAVVGTEGYFELSNTLLAPEFHAVSDQHMKKNIQRLPGNVLDKVGRLKGYTYQWKDPRTPTPMVGLIAQEVEREFPLLVTEAEGAVPGQPSTYKKRVLNYLGMIAVLVESVNELREEVNTLRKQVQPHVIPNSC